MNETRIDTLRQLIADQNRDLKAGLQKRTWIMACLVLFVLGYMTFITVSIARTVTPETIADVVLGYTAESAPAVRQKMIETGEENIPVLVDTAVDQFYLLLPEVRQALLHQVELLYPKLPEEFYRSLAKELEFYFNEKSNIIEDMLTEVDTPRERQAVFEDVARRVNTNMLMLLKETDVQTDALTAKLQILIDSPDDQLTEEQMALKEMLIYFLYLIKNMDET